MASLEYTAQSPYNVTTAPVQPAMPQVANNDFLQTIPFGLRSNTWRTQDAETAKSLAKNGVDAISIYKQTGTWLSSDGKWRQEVAKGGQFPQGAGKAGIYKLPADYNLKNEVKDIALFANSFAPVTGDIQSGVMAAQDIAKGNYGSAALNAAGLLPFVPALGGIVSKDVAKSINMPVNLPKTEEFLSAVRGTPNANITPEGLNINLVRYQKPEQELSESVRTGVFYLPEGSQQAKYYKGKGTSGGSYGGTQTISGETLYKNPLLAKGGTGGKAPEDAYKQLVGKDKFNAMQSDLMKVINSRDKGSEAYMFLETHAPDIADNAWDIVQNSKQGNQLRYALQEAVIANEARNAGHDAIIGYSKGRGDKGNFISEVFDLRESHYPSPSGEFYMNTQFEDLITK